jgi:hypothetical protein
LRPISTTSLADDDDGQDLKPEVEGGAKEAVFSPCNELHLSVTLDFS